MKRLSIGFAFFMVLAIYLYLINMDEALGRHIKLGEIILQTHSVPQINLLSFTNTYFLFINHPWLSEVIYALLYHSVGAIGILLVVCSLIILSFLAFFLLLKKRLHPVTFMIITIIGLTTNLQRTEIRPELFSNSPLLLLTTILYKNKANAPDTS